LSLTDIVRISVDAATAGVAAAGFGIPLVLSADATFPERTRTYTDLDGVLDDFTVNSPTYKAANAIFAQHPRPESIVVGRLALKPTQAWTIDLGSAGIVSSTRYRIQVVDDNGNTLNADYTTDSSALESELWSNLATNFNALVGPTATAVNTGPGTSLVITADAAGDWHSLAIINPDDQYDSGVYMSIVQNHADPGVAADLAAIKDENNTWFAIVNPFNSEAMATAIAAWAEANEKMYCAQVQDSATVTAAAGGTDFADDIAGAAYANTFMIYHPNPSKFADAAFLGALLPLQPGSETWALKQLTGIDDYPITATHKTNLEAKKCNYFYDLGGVNVTSRNGVVASGQYIDDVRGVFWLEARMRERLANLLLNAAKIPYTDRGIALIEAEVRAQLQEGIDVGLLSDDPAPTVTVPKVAAVSSADKTARILRNVRFTATLAGAVHQIEIQGSVTA
jgi:hypothetical protein